MPTPVSRHHTKVSKTLKAIQSRQLKYEKSSTKQFQDINTTVKALPSEDVIIKTIQDTIKVVVNGKIDAISAKVDMVGEHLKEQDATAATQGTAIKDLFDKVAPVTAFNIFITVLWKSVLGAGAFSAAIWAIIKLFKVHL